MKKLIFFTICLPFFSFAQNLELDWINVIDTAGANFGQGMVLDDNNNPIVVGAVPFYSDLDPGPGQIIAPTYNNYGFNSVPWIEKFDGTNGAIDWYGLLGTNLISDNSHIIDIKRDGNGNLYLCGIIAGGFSLSQDMDPGTSVFPQLIHGWYVPFYLKLDPSGNLIWSKTMGFCVLCPVGSLTNAQIGSPNKIVVSEVDYSVDICGYFRDSADLDPGPAELWFDGGNRSHFHIKLDQNGDLLWANVYEDNFFNLQPPQSTTSLTGMTDLPHDIQSDGSNGTYAAINFSGTKDVDPTAAIDMRTSNGANDILVQHIDSDGLVLWSGTFGGSGVDDFDHLETDEYGNVYVSGHFSDSADFDPGPDSLILYGDAFLVKLDNLGNLIWAKTWIDYAIHTFSITAENKILLSASAKSFIGQGDFNPGPSTHFSIYGFNISSYVISELDSLGNFLWAEEMLANRLFTSTIAKGTDGAIFISGTISGDNGFSSFQSQDFDPGSDSIVIVSDDDGVVLLNNSFFCVKYTPQCQVDITYLSQIQLCFGDSIQVFGQYISESATYQEFLTNINGCDSIIMQEIIVIDSMQNALTFSGGDISSNATGSLSYQWLDCSTNLMISGETNASYTPVENGIYALIINDGFCSDTSDCIIIEGLGLFKEEGLEFILIPNPSNGMFKIDMMQVNEAKISIYSLEGKEVFTGNVLNHESVDLTDVNPGIYIVEIVTDKTKRYRQLIID